MNCRSVYVFPTIMIVLGFLFSGCSDLVPLTDEDMLSAGSWFVDSRIVSPTPDETSGIKDELGYDQDCKSDDQLNLNFDGTFYWTAGLISCNEEGPHVSGGEWELNTVDRLKLLKFSGEESTETYIVESISKYTLVLKQEWVKTGKTETTIYKNTIFSE